MSTIALYPPQQKSTSQTPPNPLPPLLQTPSGLALLELQGTLNVPESDGSSESYPIGRLVFPDFNPDALDPSSTAWMKRVHMYIGQHQRLTGEVKKLPKPLAVVRRRSDTDSGGATVAAASNSGGQEEEAAEDLEVVEIVKYKLVFSQRPEPVGTMS